VTAASGTPWILTIRLEDVTAFCRTGDAEALGINELNYVKL